MAKFRVVRKFSSSVPHEVGDIVDFETGHIEKLLSQRYIVAFDANEPSAPVKAPRAKAEPAPAPAEETPPEAVQEAPKKKRGRPKKVQQDAVVG